MQLGKAVTIRGAAIDLYEAIITGEPFTPKIPSLYQEALWEIVLKENSFHLSCTSDHWSMFQSMGLMGDEII